MSKRFFLFTGTGFILGSVLVGFLALKLFNYALTPQNLGEPQEVFYEVRKNASPRAIAQDLYKLNVISDPTLFFWYGRITGKNSKFKAADYKFTTQMSPDQVLSVLTSGVSYGFFVAVPEGYNINQIAEILEQIRPEGGIKFLELCKDPGFIKQIVDEFQLSTQPVSLEGYLFPDTYSITKHTPIKDLIRNMVRKYRSVFTADYKNRAEQLGFSEHELVTLASIIEKETGAPHERALISSVFHNRLKKRMRLQSDPTIIYGIKNFDGNIRRKQILTKTPWNTYVVRGLPIGPIANPGKAALEAALYPATSEYLYFVSHNDGTHEFTETYKEHQKAVSRYQLNPKARQGKSWRDLRAKPSGRDLRAKPSGRDLRIKPSN